MPGSVLPGLSDNTGNSAASLIQLLGSLGHELRAESGGISQERSNQQGRV
jgi:hypothetical protein